MSSAEFTVFLCLQTFWMILFFLCHVVVTLFAFRTCQCDLYAHDFSTSMCLLSPAAHVTAVYATSCYCDKDLFLIINFSFHCKFRHKKRPTSSVATQAYHRSRSLSSFFYNEVILCSFFSSPCGSFPDELNLFVIV